MTEKHPTHASAGPRLVYDAGSEAAPIAPLPARSQRRRAVRVAVAAGLLIAGVAALAEHRRAVALEARVEELAAALAGAQVEIAARRQHLEAIRSSVAEMRERVGALETLAGSDPTPSAAASGAAPGH